MIPDIVSLTEEAAGIVRRRIAEGRNRDAQDVLGEALFLGDETFRLGLSGNPRAVASEVRQRMTLAGIEVWSDPETDPIYEAVPAEHLAAQAEPPAWPPEPADSDRES